MYRLAGVLTPYQQHLDAGRFELHTGTSGSRYTFAQARFTAKGVKWIADLWGRPRGNPTGKKRGGVNATDAPAAVGLIVTVAAPSRLR